MITRLEALALDAADPLAALRAEFALPPDVIYLDGNSLGAQPVSAPARARQVIEQEWGQALVRSWNQAGWFDLPSRLGAMLAPLIGAAPADVVISDSTSLNLFKVLAAALHQQANHPATAARRIIVSERSNFPTDLYMAEGLIAWLARGYQLRLVDHHDQLNAAIDDDVAVVMLTHVNYRSGRLLDMAVINQNARAHGALTVWDLAHSAGAVPIDLQRDGADYAVGCTYKYLNGGPGAPAFVWVAPVHQARFTHPLSGWWGHAAPFAMTPAFAPAEGIRRALCGTQPIVSLALVECGLASFQRTSMDALRSKSLALTDLFIGLVDQRCAAHDLTLATPRPHAERGSHVSLVHPDGYAVMQALIARGVIGDYREPHILRFGVTPLYTRFVDIWDAVDCLTDILDRHAYDTTAARDAVT